MAEQWTTKLVAERLEEAAATMRRLPPVRPQGYVTTWPPIIREFWEAYGYNAPEVRLGPPTPEAVERMDEALGWLRWLEADAVRLVWMRAERVPWKLIEVRFRCDRTTAWRKWTLAVARITTRLEAAGEKVLQQQGARHLQQNLVHSPP